MLLDLCLKMRDKSSGSAAAGALLLEFLGVGHSPDVFVSLGNFSNFNPICTRFFFLKFETQNCVDWLAV